MSAYGEQDLAKARWRGLKPLAAAALTLPVINGLVRLIGRRLLPSHVLHRLPVSKAIVEFLPVEAKPVSLLEPRRDQVAKDIFWGEGRPTSSADARVLRLVEKLSQDAGTFLDIGSYAGLFAMLAARSNPGLRAIAYEIVPENYLLIVRNIIENDLVKQVDARLLGLGDAASELIMPSVSLSVSNDSSISIGSQFTNGVTIPVSTLDLDVPNVATPLLMKIDVEGFEANVIEGGRALITQSLPDIICEFLEDTQAHQPVQQLLAPLGYRYFLSKADGFEERSDIQPTSEGRDWFLTVRTDIDAILTRLG